ncbi:MAG TPA: FAD-linked oxidase C-terminal domain-containing protein [Pyrinomonadaceae bacterium]|nr:FAD-linked oxidase C-terminal domain-containing protein [Pyrinomonadaceae bacterium]
MDTLVENLRAALGRGRVADDRDELLVYECDALTHYRATPRAVVFPETTEEVAEAMRLLARARVPLVPRGAGTGLSGGALAVNSGVVIELARMRRVLKVDAANRTARVQAGVVNAEVSRAAAPFGLHYAPDPSSQPICTVGGNIAENAGGIHCLKYGTTVDHVLSARVVLAGGRVVELGGECDGAPAGYDLLGLFVGSEGTFGVVTEATLRLVPLPAAVRTVLADFARIDDASRAVSAVIAAGLIPAALEMVDGATIRAVEQSVFAAGLPDDAEAALLVELDGLEAGLDAETARVESILREHGARTCRRAKDEAERKRLWAARKGAFGAMGRLSPDLMLQDAVVPRSRLPEVLAETYRVGERHRLLVANVFHAGDGNLHPYICFDARRAGEVERVKEAGREIMEACVRAGGTITGEHGVGLDKKDYLPLVFSDVALDAMARVRAAFDPDGLCNPGKVIPAPLGCGEGRAVARALALEDAAGGRPADARSATPSTPNETPTREVSSSTVTRRASDAGAREFDADDASHALARVVGAENVRRVGDSIEVGPASAAEACEVLRVAAREGWPVVPKGAGAWPDAGRARTRGSLLVSTSRLTRVVEHEPADLVVTAEAGLTLDALNAELRRARQWLALDPPGGARATLGGVVATGLGGAQALGYGRPRAHVLGMRVALADGREARFGGRVVKNVAGYDLPKLFAGSFGTLALILDVTFRLRPLPAREATVVARSGDYEKLFAAARACVGAPLLPVAAEILSRPLASPAASRDAGHALLLRFAGADETVAFQTARAQALITEHAGGDAVETFDDDAALWDAVAGRAVDDKLADGDEVGRAGTSLVWRACVPPSELPALVAEARADASRRGSQDLRWQAGAGDGRLRVFDSAEGDARETAAALARLRDLARRAGGSLVVERASQTLVEEFDPWGLDESVAALMRRVKSALDPADAFSPGRFF